MAGAFDKVAVSEERFGRALVAFVALGFGLLIAAAVAVGWNTVRTSQHTQRVAHTQQVRQAVADLQVDLEQSETARRGYLLTGQPVFLTAYRTTGGMIPARYRTIERLVEDNAAQIARLDRITPLLQRLTLLRAKSIALVRDGRLAPAQAEFAGDASVPLMRAIRYRLRAMAGEEAALLALRTQQQANAARLFYIMASVASVLLVIVATLSLTVVVRNTRALTASRDDLRRLAGSLEDRVTERTADLALANEEIQRFAYIVSHDLRSPLVNVMGFTAELESAAAPLAELVTRAEAEAPQILTEEARLAAREDLPEALGFIRTSTAKMDRLINAILQLSRQGRRTLAPEPLDLAAVCDTVIGAIRHVIDDRGVTATVVRPMPTMIADRVAVEQILSNLVENATKYLSPGRPGTVTLSARKHLGRIVMSVADNGRGIDPRDHQRIFDLFRRSGMQDQPGEGIGLAHVRALAYRMGGTISVESALGEGAKFHLTLPQDQTA